ncbi:MAG: PIN domain-containing protein [Myxococcota bacterium]
MTPVAIYDANVLYPSALRDFLIRVAIEDLIRARWSERILDEVFRNIEINRPDLDGGRLRKTRQRMCAAVLDCLVRGFEELEPAITLPDPDDRHVVAAALRAGAGIIVTFNLRDFPEVELARHGVTAMHPDVFAVEMLARHPAAVLEVVAMQAADLKNPPHSAIDVVAALERSGLARFGAAMRAGGLLA